MSWLECCIIIRSKISVAQIQLEARRLSPVDTGLGLTTGLSLFTMRQQNIITAALCRMLLEILLTSLPS